MTSLEYKHAFIRKHGKGDWEVQTSPMGKDGKYVKSYVFSDGAVLTEVNRPVDETVGVELMVKGVRFTMPVTVRLMETEIWNTDDAKSVFFYEKW